MQVSRQKKTPDTANIKGYPKNFNDLKPNYSLERGSLPLAQHEILEQFRQAIAASLGNAPPSLNPDGKLHRFSSNGKAGDLAGWYVLHFAGDFAAGAFGCWRSHISQKWHAGKASALTEVEWRAIRATLAQAKRAADEAQRAKLAASHTQAVQWWNAAKPADPLHPYLVRKGVGAYHIRQRGDLLLIPLCDLDGVLCGVQTIDPQGKKHFPKGTVKRGHFHLIGDTLTHAQGVYLCEGYATGASLYETYRLPVLVAFDAGNLLPVAQAYRARFPQVPLTVCADNDRKSAHNTGLQAAQAVCNTLQGVGLIVPEFPANAPLHLSDFNDLLALLRSSAKHEEVSP